MQENICLPHSWIDLSALHSQPQAVVSLPLQHKIQSQVPPPSYMLPHYHHQFFKAFSFTGKHNESLHMTWLYSKLIMYSTPRATTHTDKSLSYTHIRLYTLSPSPNMSSHDQGPVHSADKEPSSYYVTEIVPVILTYMLQGARTYAQVNTVHNLRCVLFHMPCTYAHWETQTV